MEGESSEFQDWEVLSDCSGSALVQSDLDEEEGEAVMEGDSEGVIRSDYFSIDFGERYDKSVSGFDLGEEGLVEFDDPSWVGPGLQNRYGTKNPGEFLADSGSDGSDERRFSDFDAKIELGSVGIFEMGSELGVGGVGEELGARDLDLGLIESGEGKYSCLDAKIELCLIENDKSDEGFGEVVKQDEELDRFLSDSGDARVSMKLGDFPQNNEMGFADYTKEEDNLGLSEVGNSRNVESREGDEQSEKESGDGALVEMKPDANPIDVGDKRRVVWWKVPLEFLKFCAFRVNPVWSFSVAAALMGFIILGRRLSRMKRKTQSLQLKVTLDEKKAALFKSRAARLNEAFSVVRRVPIARSPHPAAGLASWPVMSLR